MIVSRRDPERLQRLSLLALFFRIIESWLNITAVNCAIFPLEELFLIYISY